MPFELSPIVEPSVARAEQMTDGRLEGLVVKDRRSPYRDGSRTGSFKVKNRSWYEREGLALRAVTKERLRHACRR